MPSAGAQADLVTASATIGGRDVAAARSGQPLRLYPDQSVEVIVELANHGTQPVHVRRVELTGRVLGLKFFSYATMIDAVVPPGGSDTVRYELDLTGLRGQATGLIAGELAVVDTAGNRVVTISTVTDVRGSLISVFGLFGIGLAVLTVLAIVDAALAISRHRLSANRWHRGLRLLTPGLGIGLVLGFTTSVTRLWLPNTGLWLLIAGGTAAAFFAVGYVSPTPHEELDTADVETDVEPDSDEPDSEESETEMADAETEAEQLADQGCRL
jgi:hypothetical protein